ncbi:MAG: hypothetical protein H0U04_02040 [Rubrobacter sp.]|jgi:hypothetical protein|nr:hypothetical protein [Rubrobacter sp.]
MVRTGKLKLGVVAAGLAVVLAVTVLALLATQPADAASKYKVVTRTFSNSQPITIPLGGGAATPYPSEKNASGFKKGRILDANLTLKTFSHTHPDDVDVMLSHRGVNRTVMSDVGGSGDALNIALKLDDEATLPLPDEAQLTGGTFKPTNFGGLEVFPAPAPTPSGLAELSGFDGKNPNGPWQLRVADDFSGHDGGQLAGGWSITIKARVLR